MVMMIIIIIYPGISLFLEFEAGQPVGPHIPERKVHLRTIESSRHYNTDTRLDVVFDFFPGRVFTVTSFVYARLLVVGTHTHRAIVYTSVGNKSKTTYSLVL